MAFKGFSRRQRVSRVTRTRACKTIIIKLHLLHPEHKMLHRIKSQKRKNSSCSIHDRSHNAKRLLYANSVRQIPPNNHSQKHNRLHSALSTVSTQHRAPSSESHRTIDILQPRSYIFCVCVCLWYYVCLFSRSRLTLREYAFILLKNIK